MKKILVIQTAFIGDAILATAVLEKLHEYYPKASLYFLVRKGNESLFHHHPYIKEILVWNKAEKYTDMLRLIKHIRNLQFDDVINLQRFASSGIFTAFSGAKYTIGFKKNPLSFLFSETHQHAIGNGKHEIERNQLLIEKITDAIPAKPKLYISENDFEAVKKYQAESYVCIAPASVWFTKQLPVQQWATLLNALPKNMPIYILGSKADEALAQQIINAAQHNPIKNLCGQLTLLQSAALMQKALMNYVNDSAPLHLCSAMNAPVTAFFCATIPAFGFTPLSDKSIVAEIAETLPCRPCNLHGKTHCPQKHFKCALGIDVVKYVVA